MGIVSFFCGFPRIVILLLLTANGFASNNNTPPTIPQASSGTNVYQTTFTTNQNNQTVTKSFNINAPLTTAQPYLLRFSAQDCKDLKRVEIKLNNDLISYGSLAKCALGLDLVVTLKQNNTLKIKPKDKGAYTVKAIAMFSAPIFNRDLRTERGQTRKTLTFTGTPGKQAVLRISGDDDEDDDRWCDDDNETGLLNLRGTVKFNGSVAFNHQTLHRRHFILNTSVTLAANNTIVLDLQGTRRHDELNVQVIPIATTNPALALTSPTDGFITQDFGIVFTGTVSGTNSPRVVINGQSYPTVGGTFAVTVPLAAEGENSFDLYAVDGNGRESEHIQRMVIRDTTPPQCSLSFPPDGFVTNQPELTFFVNCWDDVSGLPSLTSSLGPDVVFVPHPDFEGTLTTTTTFPEGTTSFTFTTTDSVGNNADFGPYSVTVDTVPPVISFSSNIPREIIERELSLGFESTEPFGAVEVNHNGASVFSGSSWSNGTSIPLDGFFHALDAEVADQAGNFGEHLHADFVFNEVKEKTRVFFDFEDISGDVVRDANGRGAIGTIVVAQELSPSSGWEGNGLTFDESSDALTITGFTAVGLGSAGFTLSLMVNPGIADGHLLSLTSSSHVLVLTHDATDGLSLSIGGIIHKPNLALPLDAWSSLALRIVPDEIGLLLNNQEILAISGPTSVATPNQLILGAEQLSPALSASYDNLRLIKEPLSEAERCRYTGGYTVSAGACDYTALRGAVGFFDFEASAPTWWGGSEIPDHSLPLNYGLAQDGATLVPGKYGSGLSLGNGAFFMVPNLHGTLLTQDPLTLSFWIRPDNPDFLLSLQHPGSIDIMADAGSMNVYSQASDESLYVEKPNLLPPGEFTHVALVVEGTIATLYINGLVVGVEAFSLPIGGFQEEHFFAAPPWIGNVEGVIDELRIRSFAASEEEICNSTGDSVFIAQHGRCFGLDDPGFGDSDGDSSADLVDAFPLDPNEQLDTDGDGIGDNADLFPTDAGESADADFDGFGNREDVDDDNDGVLDDLDCSPFSDAGLGNADTDGDLLCDNVDTDLDGDGFSNANDAFLHDPSEWLDTDGDGSGDRSDLDSDDDGVRDSLDTFPLDPTEQFDGDQDGSGDLADLDDDRDGIVDTGDTEPLNVIAPRILAAQYFDDLSGDALATVGGETTDLVALSLVPGFDGTSGTFTWDSHAALSFSSPLALGPEGLSISFLLNPSETDGQALTLVGTPPVEIFTEAGLLSVRVGDDVCRSSRPLLPDVWQHVVVSQSQAGVAIFLNGEQTATCPDMGQASATYVQAFIGGGLNALLDDLILVNGSLGHRDRCTLARGRVIAGICQVGTFRDARFAFAMEAFDNGPADTTIVRDVSHSQRHGNSSEVTFEELAHGHALRVIGEGLTVPAAMEPLTTGEATLSLAFAQVFADEEPWEVLLVEEAGLFSLSATADGLVLDLPGLSLIHSQPGLFPYDELVSINVVTTETDVALFVQGNEVEREALPEPLSISNGELVFGEVLAGNGMAVLDDIAFLDKALNSEELCIRQGGNVVADYCHLRPMDEHGSLVLSLPFDDTSGDRAPDHSGHRLDAVGNSTLSTIFGFDGLALDLEASVDISILPSLLFGFRDAFTARFSYVPDRYNEHCALLSHPGRYTIALLNGFPALLIPGAPSPWFLAASEPLPGIAQSTFAVRYGQNAVDLIVNGQIAGSSQAPGLLAADLGTPLSIGQSNDAALPALPPCKGFLADLILHDAALSDQSLCGMESCPVRSDLVLSQPLPVLAYTFEVGVGGTIPSLIFDTSAAISVPANYPSDIAPSRTSLFLSDPSSDAGLRILLPSLDIGSPFALSFAINSQALASATWLTIPGYAVLRQEADMLLLDHAEGTTSFANSVQPELWHQINLSRAFGELRLVIDGQWLRLPDPAPGANPADIIVGTDGFFGYIDDVLVWDVALTELDVCGFQGFTGYDGGEQTCFADDSFVLTDTDDDGVPDAADHFVDDPLRAFDRDGDGVADDDDAFPGDPTEWEDSDNDGVGNTMDEAPFDPSDIYDQDGDGVGDSSDSFPLDSFAASDQDGNGIPDQQSPPDDTLLGLFTFAIQDGCAFPPTIPGRAVLSSCKAALVNEGIGATAVSVADAREPLSLSTSEPIGPDLSLSFWLRSDRFNETSVLLDFPNGERLVLSNGELFLDAEGEELFHTDIAVVPGLFTHLSVVHSETSGDSFFFINGQFLRSVPMPLFPEGEPLALSIGAASDGSNPLVGIIDHVELVGKVLSAAELLQRYASGLLAIDASLPQPVAYTQQLHGDLGGTVTVDNPESPLDGLVVTVPAEAFDRPVTIGIGEANFPTPGYESLGTQFRLTASEPGPFAKPVRVEVPVDGDTLDALTASGEPLAVLRRDEGTGRYELIPNVVLDPDNGTFAFLTTHFSTFTLVTVPYTGVWSLFTNGIIQCPAANIKNLPCNNGDPELRLYPTVAGQLYWSDGELNHNDNPYEVELKLKPSAVSDFKMTTTGFGNNVNHCYIDMGATLVNPPTTTNYANSILAKTEPMTITGNVSRTQTLRVPVGGVTKNVSCTFDGTFSFAKTAELSTIGVPSKHTFMTSAGLGTGEVSDNLPIMISLKHKKTATLRLTIESASASFYDQTFVVPPTQNFLIVNWDGRYGNTRVAKGSYTLRLTTTVPSSFSAVGTYTWETTAKVEISTKTDTSFLDSDGDLVANNTDAFPNDCCQVRNFDGDKLGDDSKAIAEKRCRDVARTPKTCPEGDTDDDSDDISDLTDCSPLNDNKEASLNTDGDTYPKSTTPLCDDQDTDDDGDGVLDIQDGPIFDPATYPYGRFSKDKTEWADADNDGIGDNKDPVVKLPSEIYWFADAAGRPTSTTNSRGGAAYTKRQYQNGEILFIDKAKPVLLFVSPQEGKGSDRTAVAWMAVSGAPWLKVRKSAIQDSAVAFEKNETNDFIWLEVDTTAPEFVSLGIVSIITETQVRYVLVHYEDNEGVSAKTGEIVQSHNVFRTIDAADYVNKLEALLLDNAATEQVIADCTANFTFGEPVSQRCKDPLVYFETPVRHMISEIREIIRIKGPKTTAIIQRLMAEFPIQAADVYGMPLGQFSKLTKMWNIVGQMPSIPPPKFIVGDRFKPLYTDYTDQELNCPLFGVTDEYSIMSDIAEGRRRNNCPRRTDSCGSSRYRRVFELPGKNTCAIEKWRPSAVCEKWNSASQVRVLLPPDECKSVNPTSYQWGLPGDSAGFVENGYTDGTQYDLEKNWVSKATGCSIYYQDYYNTPGTSYHNAKVMEPGHSGVVPFSFARSSSATATDINVAPTVATLVRRINTAAPGQPPQGVNFWYPLFNQPGVIYKGCYIRSSGSDGEGFRYAQSICHPISGCSFTDDANPSLYFACAAEWGRWSGAEILPAVMASDLLSEMLATPRSDTWNALCKGIDSIDLHLAYEQYVADLNRPYNEKKAAQQLVAALTSVLSIKSVSAYSSVAQLEFSLPRALASKPAAIAVSILAVVVMAAVASDIVEGLIDAPQADADKNPQTLPNVPPNILDVFSEVAAQLSPAQTTEIENTINDILAKTRTNDNDVCGSGLTKYQFMTALMSGARIINTSGLTKFGHAYEKHVNDPPNIAAGYSIWGPPKGNNQYKNAQGSLQFQSISCSGGAPYTRVFATTSASNFNWEKRTPDRLRGVSLLQTYMFEGFLDKR